MGTCKDGQERFWRNIFAGISSSRFHRPESGLGLDSTAQAHILSMRMFTDSLWIFDCKPHNELLSEREENEAYCIAHPGVKYGVYFPEGGDVVLDLTEAKEVQIQWLNILKSEWKAPARKKVSKRLTLSVHDNDRWAVLV